MLGAWPAHREQRTEADVGDGALGESEPEIGAGSQGERGIITAFACACAVATVVLAGFAAMPAAAARPSDPGVVNHVVLDKGSVGDIVGATIGWEDMSTVPMQDYWVDLPVCNNYADIGLPEVYNDPGLASFNSAVMQESPTDETHYVKQAVGVFATNDAAKGAFHRILDRTGGCSGQTTAMHIDNGTTEVWLVHQRCDHRHRRRVEQAGSRHRPSLLHPNPAAGKRSAAGEGVSVGRWRSCGERAGGCDAEHARAITARTNKVFFAYPMPPLADDFLGLAR